MYTTFEKIIMNYQVSSRISYLGNFTFLFKETDSDDDGVLNDQEFISFVEKLKCYSSHLEEQAYRLLSIIDPYEVKKITYSDCVSLFSKEHLDFDGKSINVMDFIAMNWSSYNTSGKDEDAKSEVRLRENLQKVEEKVESRIENENKVNQDISENIFDD